MSGQGQVARHLMPLKRTGIDKRVEMDVVGSLEGADKSSAVGFCWDYLKHLEPLFAEFRDCPIDIFEVGIRGGASLRLWKSYFPNARITGIDINPSCARLAEDRVVIKIGSQADAGFLRRLCLDTPPTIFIDDGSHQAPHNIFTFEHVFPLLLPGGIYVVEDLAFQYGEHAAQFQGEPARNSPEYFLDLARSRLARKPVQGQEKSSERCFGMIDSILFIDGAVAIRKKYTSRDIAAAVLAAEHHIEINHRATDTTPRSDMQQRLAAYILRHNGDLELAHEFCRRSLGHQRTIAALTTQAEILLRQDQKSDARAPLEEASEILTRSQTVIDRVLALKLANVQASAGLIELALSTTETMLKRAPNSPGIRQLHSRLKDAGDMGSASGNGSVR